MTAPRTPAEIADEIVHHVGAMLHDTDEARAMYSAIVQAIREERRGAIHLTKGEARAAREAISQMTDGCARSFAEWKLATHGSYREWKALLSAESKIAEAAK